MTRPVLLALGFLAVLQIVAFHGLRHDDAFITLRYSQNLAQGNGFVFNPGERIMGSTSPGHAMIGALAYLIAGKALTPSVVSALGCVGWSLQSLAIFLLLGMVTTRRISLFVALCVAVGAAHSHRFVALETHLAAASVIWTLYLAVRGSFTAAAVLASLAGILRPDAYLAVAPALVLCVRARKWSAWKPIAIGACLSAPWYVFAIGYFGSPFPQSASAKVGTLTISEYASWALPYVTENVVLPRVELLASYADVGFPSVPHGFVATFVLALTALGVWTLLRRRPVLIVLPAYGLLTALAYVFFLRAAVGIDWHLYPVLLVVAVCSLLFVGRLTEWVPAGRRRDVVQVVVFGCVLAFYLFRTGSHATDQDRLFWYNARHDVYERAARFLAGNAEKGDAWTGREVGTIAYYSELPAIDQAGLITPNPGERIDEARFLIPFYSSPQVPNRVFVARSAPVSDQDLRFRGRDRVVVAVLDRKHTPPAPR